MFSVLLLVAVTAGAYWASLEHSLNGLEAAVRDRDVIKLEKYIDWVRVREQVRSELKGAMTANLVKEATQENKGAGAAFGTIVAGAIAPAVIDQLVDGYVTTRSLAQELEKNQLQLSSLTRIGLTDIDEYTLAAGNDQEFKLILRRDGLTWRVAAIRLPDLFWEQSGPGAGRRAPSKEMIAHTSVERLASVLDMYKLNIGSYPTTEQGLQALITRPQGVARWDGPYIKGDKLPEDPWGRPFSYRNPSQRPGHDFDLYSLGPDGNAASPGDKFAIFNE